MLEEKWVEFLYKLYEKYPQLSKDLHEFVVPKGHFDDRIAAAGQDLDKMTAAKKANQEDFVNFLASKTSQDEAEEFRRILEECRAAKKVQKELFEKKWEDEKEKRSHCYKADDYMKTIGRDE